MTREDWIETISRWQSTGRPMTEFCKKEGINYWTFRDWKTRILQPSYLKETKLVKLNSIQVSNDEINNIEIFIGKAKIIVPKSFDEAHLLNIISALGKIS
ncbi:MULTISPECIES: hypothetical protein [unclassified Oceanispirochaeta]|uniref:IS66 family insertion sequence element accessory protein TnpA n=1 Tax=unclassified Oceanispirochaeta TaxID=2635722 RepID=UPI000E08D9BD|nr:MULTISPECIES: hypothetical protein [unclassified Oceanispirochaeta]MBF9017260.1 hypothetical protein [Oceanispirochaeta sp. M2]NPD75375.1 hypothetical protein [Oceanispirochaeta sp. M1]RDG28779.1 hypothetical protein DV872_25095 [Oceanispirochaeta sp. M1]